LRRSSFSPGGQNNARSAIDQLWKQLKGDLAANRQFENIAEAIDYVEQ